MARNFPSSSSPLPLLSLPPCPFSALVFSSYYCDLCVSCTSPSQQGQHAFDEDLTVGEASLTSPRLFLSPFFPLKATPFLFALPLPLPLPSSFPSRSSLSSPPIPLSPS